LFLSLHYEDFLNNGMAEQLLQEFNEKNPDIRIHLLNPEAASPAGASPTASAEIRQNRGSPPVASPDIFIFDEGDFSALVAEGLLADLSFYYSLINSGVQESEEDDFDDAPPMAVMQQTSQYAVPLVSFMDMLFYNIEILSAAGFDHPPKTRDEFLACIRAVSRGNFPGVSGTVLSLSPEDRQAVSRDIFSWIWAAGGNFWSEENNLLLTSASHNTRAVANDITFLSSLYREVQTQGIFEQTGDQRIEEFAQGRIALMIASTRYIPYLRERMGDSVFGITTIPVPAAGGRYSKSLSSIHVGISSDSLYPDEAWRFLKFLVERNALFCKKLNAVPGSVLNLIPGDYVRDDPFYSKAWDIFEASRIVQGFSGIPNVQEYESAFLEDLQVFFEGGRTALQTVVAIQQRWEEIWDEIQEAINRE
jgi:multiple sugar transport system substrate-binding protein